MDEDLVQIKRWLEQHDSDHETQTTTNHPYITYNSLDIPDQNILERGNYDYIGGTSPLNFFIRRKCDSVTVNYIEKQLSSQYKNTNLDYHPVSRDIVAVSVNSVMKRGEIVNVFDYTDIRVRLLDYNKVIQAEISGITPITHHKFIRTPRLVYTVRLFGVMCPEEHNEKLMNFFQLKMKETSPLKVLPVDKTDDNMWNIRAKILPNQLCLAEELQHCGLVTDASAHPTSPREASPKRTVQSPVSLDFLITELQHVSLETCSDQLILTRCLCQDAAEVWASVSSEHKEIFLVEVKSIVAAHENAETSPRLGGVQRTLNSLESLNQHQSSGITDWLRTRVRRVGQGRDPAADREVVNSAGVLFEQGYSYLKQHLRDFVQKEGVQKYGKLHEEVLATIDRMQFPIRVETTDTIKTVNAEIRGSLADNISVDRAFQDSIDTVIMPHFRDLLDQIYVQFNATLEQELDDHMQKFHMSVSTGHESDILCNLNQLTDIMDDFEKLSCEASTSAARLSRDLEQLFGS